MDGAASVHQAAEGKKVEMGVGSEAGALKLEQGLLKFGFLGSLKNSKEGVSGFAFITSFQAMLLLLIQGHTLRSTRLDCRGPGRMSSEELQEVFPQGNGQGLEPGFV